MPDYCRHLILFAKAPRLGRVKRRLAADIGALAALHFYENNLRGLIRRLGRHPGWRTWLAVTPDSSAGGHPWSTLAPGLPSFGQGTGDLGMRMGRAFDNLPPGPALLIGADIPSVAPAHIERAFALLGRHDAVFGPATDGGYWLVGFSRAPTTPRPFAGVRWSTEHALADTLSNLTPRFTHALTNVLADVDDGSAYAGWRAEG